MLRENVLRRKEDFDRIYEELEQVSMTVEALQLWCEKMKIKSKDK